MSITNAEAARLQALRAKRVPPSLPVPDYPGFTYWVSASGCFLHVYSPGREPPMAVRHAAMLASRRSFIWSGDEPHHWMFTDHGALGCVVSLEVRQ